MYIYNPETYAFSVGLTRRNDWSYDQLSDAFFSSSAVVLTRFLLGHETPWYSEQQIYYEWNTTKWS